MAVQFSHTNRAIDRFMASQQADNTERRAETQDFERRRQTEQAMGVDKGLREFFAGQQNPVAAVPARPAVAAPVTAAPAQSQQPATAQMPPIVRPELTETGNTNQAPAAPMQADIAKPDANVVPNEPEIRAAVLSPATPAPAINSFRAGMEKLATIPGTGAAMGTLHNQEQQRQERGANRDAQATRLRQAAEIQAIKALHTGDPQIALAIAGHYNINIPPEVIKNAQFQQRMRNLGDLIKRNGINDDVMAAGITREYLGAISQGADEQTALTTAFNKAPKPAGKGPKTHYDSMRGAFVEEPSPENPNGRTLQPPSLPARQVATGGGGRGGASGNSVFRQKQAAWLEIHPGDKQGALDFAGGKRGVTPADLQRAANNILNASKGISGKPTITYDAAYAKAQQMLSAGGNGGPAPASGPKRIRYDSQGNRIQ